MYENNWDSIISNPYWLVLRHPNRRTTCAPEGGMGSKRLKEICKTKSDRYGGSPMEMLREVMDKGI